MSEQEYILEEKFNEAYALADKCARQIAKFISYLETHTRPRRVAEETTEYRA